MPPKDTANKSPSSPSEQNSPTEEPPPDTSGERNPVRIDPSVEDPTTEELLREFLTNKRQNLDPIAPKEAVETYLRDKARECAHSTVNAHRSRLNFFIDWCDDQGISNLNELSARDLHDFRVMRREELKVVSERTQMVTLRVFIQWCESIEAVEPGLYEKIVVPKIPGKSSRDEALDWVRTQRILEHLRTFEYATTAHVCWVVLTNTGMRLGSARGLDVADYYPDEDPPYLDIRHRPGSDTPLKKGKNGERPVSLTVGVCEVIDDYLEHRRQDITDNYDREPLLTTSHGRIGKSTIRKYIYKWSRPCVVGRECPHDRNPLDCEAAVHHDLIAQCPSSVTPHPIRRGYITKLLQADVPVAVVSKRCDVSPDIIEQHYDVRSEEAKMRQRQKILEDSLGNHTSDLSKI